VEDLVYSMKRKLDSLQYVFVVILASSFAYSVNSMYHHNLSFSPIQRVENTPRMRFALPLGDVSRMHASVLLSRSATHDQPIACLSYQLSANYTDRTIP
jgi:hypothetical protein